MAVNVNVRRLAQQKTRVREVHLRQLPDPPPSLVRFPGFAEWWNQMRKIREEDQQQISNMILTDIDVDGGNA